MQGAGAGSMKKTRGGGDDEEDLTQGLEDPPSEPRIVEVVASPANPSMTGSGSNSTGSNATTSGSKKIDSDMQPLKSGNMADLDEQMDGTETTFLL